MIKRATLIIIVLGWLLAVVSPVPVLAQAEPVIQNTSVRIQFPTSLEFNMSARSDVNVTDVRLLYWVEQRQFAEVTSEAFVDVRPATTVNARWVWDMRRTGGLPPGSVVNYRWSVQDARGGKIESRTAQVRFDDTRYTWQNLVENRVTLYWYQGSEAFARELMAAAQQGLARLEKDTGARLEQPVKMYIYASSRDLQGAMVFPQEWTGGAAYSSYGIIVIGIAQNQLDWGKRTITHELTHLVVDQLTFNPYNSPPTWLQEGLAMYNEGPLERQFTGPLNRAIADKTLISVRTLASPFSALGDVSMLSYAESHSLVQFLITRYGQGKMFDLLTAFKEGSGFDEALQKAYGFNMDGLNNQWRSSLTQAPQTAKPAAMTTGGGVPVMRIIRLALVGVAVLVLLIVVVRKRPWR